VNFAIATDGPGFTIEVPNQASGDNLSLPPWLEPKRAMIEHRLRPKDPTPVGTSAAPKR
jgi:glyoxalase family protein